MHTKAERGKKRRDEQKIEYPHSWNSAPFPAHPVTIKLQLKLLVAPPHIHPSACKYATRFLFKYHSIFKSNPYTACVFFFFLLLLGTAPSRLLLIFILFTLTSFLTLRCFLERFSRALFMHSPSSLNGYL